MNPFYQVDGITIYNADNADILPMVDPADVGLLLTDPPYGIGFKSGKFHRLQTIENDDAPFDPGPLLTYNRKVLWGAENFVHDLPISRGRIVWDKRDLTSRDLPGSDAEMAWTDVTHQIRIYRQVWMPHTIRGEPVLHPTQKPVKLMRWIVENWTDPGDLVFDPYMGSGPVAKACQELGRRYIGVEIVEEYCQAAVNRLAQAPMFTA